MSDLTIEKMDKINFLVTEVSLECLGNKFFDVYGNQNSSLLGLISYNSLRKPSTEPESDTALWKSLTAERQQPIIEQRIQSVEKAVSNEPRRKRRASCSITNNEPDTSDDPESLLVPMPVAPKAAKIMQRRSTISVQLAKNRKMTSPIAQRKSRRQAQPTNEDGKATKTASVAEIKQNLKKDTNLRYNAMRLLSQSQEEKYRTLNSNPNMENFFKAEEKSLFSQCNTLIKFIKFIQEDRNNSSKLGHISQAILELQKEF